MEDPARNPAKLSRRSVSTAVGAGLFPVEACPWLVARSGAGQALGSPGPDLPLQLIPKHEDQVLL